MVEDPCAVSQGSAFCVLLQLLVPGFGRQSDFQLALPMSSGLPVALCGAAAEDTVTSAGAFSSRPAYRISLPYLCLGSIRSKRTLRTACRLDLSRVTFEVIRRLIANQVTSRPCRLMSSTSLLEVPGGKSRKGMHELSLNGSHRWHRPKCCAGRYQLAERAGDALHCNGRWCQREWRM